MTVQLPAATAAAPLPGGPSAGKSRTRGWGAQPRGAPAPPSSAAGRAWGSCGLPYSQRRYVSCRDLKTCCSSKASFDFTVTSSSETHSYYTAE